MIGRVGQSKKNTDSVPDYEQIIAIDIVKLFGRFIKYYVKATQDQPPRPRPRDAAQVLLAAQRRFDSCCHPASVVSNRRDKLYNDLLA